MTAGWMFYEVYNFLYLSLECNNEFFCHYINLISLLPPPTIGDTSSVVEKQKSLGIDFLFVLCENGENFTWAI